MSNQNHNIPTVTSGEISPWRQFADETLQPFMAGDLLKFVKGDWILGEEKNEIPPTTPFLTNMNEVWIGWVRWWDGVPTEHDVGRIVDQFKVPPRSELGDFDKTLWEKPDKDPWAKVTYLVLCNLENNNELMTCAATSDGGRKAIAKLCDRYDRLRSRHPGKMPVILLGRSGYDHPNRNLRWVDTPTLKIVEWRTWDVEAPADASDDIPF